MRCTVALITLLALSVALPAATAAPGAYTHTITDDDFPSKIEVEQGSTVTWKNQDRPHTVTSTSGPVAFDSGFFDAGDSFSFTFDTAGTYTYVCEYHEDMVATVVVSAPASSGSEENASTGDNETSTGGDGNVTDGGGSGDGNTTSDAPADGNATDAPAGGNATDAPADGNATDDAAPSNATSPKATVVVRITDDLFGSGTIVVEEATRVTWENDDRPHTVTSESGPASFDSGFFTAGDNFSFVFDEAGTYAYICLYHDDMKGTVVVVPAEADGNATDDGEDANVGGDGADEGSDDAPPAGNGTQDDAGAEANLSGPASADAPAPTGAVVAIAAGLIALAWRRR